MSFVTTLALSIGLLVSFPYIAHRVRRLRRETIPFAPVRLVPEGAAQARVRSKLEDRALFVVRVLMVLLLALLGAGPLMKGSPLAVARSSGAPVGLVLVLDDSLSMSARYGGATRFERAKSSAKEILGSLREGDSVAIVLAGAPLRVLFSGGSVGAARDILASVGPTARATDLEGALTEAERIAESMPEADHRIALLSDLADGRPDGTPLGRDLHAKLWLPLPELEGQASDCGIVSAELDRGEVRCRIACSPVGAVLPRDVSLIDARGRVQATLPLPSARGGDLLFKAGSSPLPLTVRLGGEDAIAVDDTLAVSNAPEMITVGFIGNHNDAPGSPSELTLVTGALAALESEVSVRPLASLPDSLDELRPYNAIFHDNPNGYTPEQRRALDAYVREGASVFVALGASSKLPPLGSSFEPFIRDPVAWGPSTVRGGSENAGSALFAGVLPGLSDLHPEGRATMSGPDAAGFETLLYWNDGAPLVARKRLGRGAFWAATLPLSPDESDLPFRPAFLQLFAVWAEDVRHIAPVQTVTAGRTWEFAGESEIDVLAPDGVHHRIASRGERALPLDQAGTYSARVEGRNEERLVRILPEELDLRPRPLATPAGASPGEGADLREDQSRWVALLLLVALCAEIVLRALAWPKPRETVS